MLKAQKQKPWVRTWAAAKLAHLEYVQKANTQPGFGSFLRWAFMWKVLLKLALNFHLKTHFLFKNN